MACPSAQAGAAVEKLPGGVEVPGVPGGFLDNGKMIQRMFTVCSGSGQPEVSQSGSRRRASASRGVAAMMAFARAISSW